MSNSSNDEFSSNEQKYCCFKESLTSLIKRWSTNPHIPISINETSAKFCISRRRFYDAALVMVSIGLCSRKDFDMLVWKGYGHARATLRKICEERGIFNGSQSLSHLVRFKGSITISQIAIAFLVSFIALQQQTLNILTLSQFISADNGRTQTTRCKLYQASIILQILGIISKTETTSVFRLNDQFFHLWNAEIHHDIDGPLSFNCLLNTRTDKKTANLIKKRNNAFEKYCIQ